jgi:hypothetical protein
MPDVLVQIVNENSITQKVTAGANGYWSTQVAEGKLTSTIDETDPNIRQGAVQTQGNNPTTTTIIAGDEFQEEPDGFLQLFKQEC